MPLSPTFPHKKFSTDKNAENKPIKMIKNGLATALRGLAWIENLINKKGEDRINSGMS